MKRRIYLAVGLCLAALSAFAVFCRSRAEKPPAYILRYSDNQPEDYPSSQAGLYFARLVEKRTGGDVKIYVYSGGVLGDEASVIRQVQFGGIDMARVSSAQLIIHEPSMAVLSLPYIYKDSTHMWRVLDGKTGDYFLKQAENADLIGLSWYDAGARSFYTAKKPVHTLDDLSGMRIRVQEAGYMEDFVRALGAIPDSMPYSDVYAGLSTGIVDGAENNWPSYESAGHYKIAPYVLEDDHLRIPEMQVLSQKTAENLPADYLKIIQECAKESSLYERTLWQEREKQARKDMIDAGVTISTLSSAEHARFEAACRPLYERYGAGYEDLIEAIRAEAD